MSEGFGSLMRRWRTRAMHVVFLLQRPMTLGVRGIVVDDEDRVLLVRHSYVPGWHFPGGGVERGEDVLTSLKRELQEEANVVLTGAPSLHGIFHQASGAGRDHVVVYVVRAFVQTGPRAPDREIREARFFARGALPEGTTRATLSRLGEVFGGAPISPVW
jgi:ADP-ribose pyrophosphatase YjhB (NUDIX family)